MVIKGVDGAVPDLTDDDMVHTMKLQSMDVYRSNRKKYL